MLDAIPKSRKMRRLWSLFFLPCWGQKTSRLYLRPTSALPPPYLRSRSDIMGEHRDGVGGGLGEVWHKAIQEEEEKALGVKSEEACRT